MTPNQGEGKKEQSKKEKVEKAVGKLDGIAKDLSTLLREGETIVTVKGEEVVVPGLSGKSEKMVIKTIVQYLRDHSDILQKMFGDEKEGLGVEDILSFIIDVAEDGYDTIQELASHILGKPIEWIDNHLLVPDLISIIAPFIKAEVFPIARAIRKNLTLDHLGQMMKKKMGEVKQAAEKRKEELMPSSQTSEAVPEGSGK